MSSNPITISTLNSHINTLFERDEMLRDLWVVGEVSNWKRASSGHIYFSLKDSGATISAVMWRNAAQSHAWLPQEGDQVLAHGYVGVYPERGSYQFYANMLRPAGRGQLYAQFEALKAKMEAEGFFSQERKRTIPTKPQRIGIVTSADAAALRDILRLLTARWPLLDVIVFSTLVQGNEAPAQIEAAIGTANRYSREVEPLDALILARGGGSIEDLWSFNDPRVAYAVAASELPVVCGVGHETDFTIADFVADLRAPTPSAAAVALSPDRAEVQETLTNMQEWLIQHAEKRLEDERWQLDQVQKRLARLHPGRSLDLQHQRLDDRLRRLNLNMRNRLDRAQQSITTTRLRLTALNPTGVLKRGYSIVQRADGMVVTQPDQAASGDILRVQAAGGEYFVKKSERNEQ